MEPKRLAPKNVLRPRTFVRILQKSLLGELRDKPSFKECIEHDSLRSLADNVMVQSSWSDWWNGKRTPNQSMRKALDAVTNNLATKWLEPCITKNRLACHLCWFDLAGVVEKSLEHGHQKAYSILLELAKEWKPLTTGFHGYRPCEPLYIKNNVKSVHDSHHLDKNLRGKANLCSSYLHKFDRLNPSSILLFLLNLGLEDWSNDYDTAAAIAMDFTTAMLLCVSIIYMTPPAMSAHQAGDVGKIAFSVSNFWFTDIEPDERTLSILSEIKSITNLDIDRLLTLRQIYQSEISITGLSLSELKELVFYNIEVIIHYGILAEDEN